jgi:hypothetical protein
VPDPIEAQTSVVALESWDPLARFDEDVEVYAAAQKREIRNILKSYTGYYDLFSEMLQNGLDAVERRKAEGSPGYQPTVIVHVDLQTETVTVADNGCAMNLGQFKQFLKPNLSFKDGIGTRGNKGVGTTYLAYGFNHLEVATKPSPDAAYAGLLRDGRLWLDDMQGLVSRPAVEPLQTISSVLGGFDRGTSITLKLVGANIRPKNLKYIFAKTAEQWLALFRVHTPIGGIYLCGDVAPEVNVQVRVTDENGVLTEASIPKPKFLYPHEVLGKTGDLREFLADQLARATKGLDVSKTPAKFSNLNGFWGEWSSAEILAGTTPLRPALTQEQRVLMQSLTPQIYAFMCYTTDLWDDYSDNKLALRKGTRLLRGGIQQATKHMPQGPAIAIPLTSNIGFQQITLVIVQFSNAEPDLGRKGFQPEHTDLAEALARSVVPAYRRYFDRLLRKNTGAPALMQQMKLADWIDKQKEHEAEFPLVITGTGLFAPKNELAIRSVPIVEQDVVALFNQMLSSGLIRGIQLLSSSQFNQYDGLFRFKMEPPFDLYTYRIENPLGVLPETFTGMEEALQSPVSVLEYKFNLDALIEEFDNGVKDSNDVKLAVCWEIGTRWKEHFSILSYLDDDNLHHRTFHGVTHHFSHAVSGASAFSVIVLKDLIAYLVDEDAESARQKAAYGEDFEP